MSLIYTVIIGFFIGIVAKFLMPGRDPGGFIITSVLGIAGSLIATYLGQNMGYYYVGEPAGFFAGVLGAMLILFGYRILVRRS